MADTELYTNNTRPYAETTIIPPSQNDIPTIRCGELSNEYRGDKLATQASTALTTKLE